MRHLVVAQAVFLAAVLAICSAALVRSESERLLGFDACSCHSVQSLGASQHNLGKSAQPASESASAPFTLKILGDRDFVHRTEDALELIATRAPDYYAVVIHDIGLIEAVDRGSGAWVWEDPPRFTVGKATSHSPAGPLWYAGVMVHDAWHIKQYREYRSSHAGQPVPAEVYSGEQAELAALAAQRDALEMMGAPEWMLSWTVEVAATAYWEVEDRAW